MNDIARDALGAVSWTSVFQHADKVVLEIKKPEWEQSLAIVTHQDIWFNMSRESKVELIRSEVERMLRE